MPTMGMSIARAPRYTVAMKLPDAEALWQYTGRTRPPFADEPGPGQESVWDYPRPPRIAVCEQTVTVVHRETVVARTQQALRVLETASPPTVYLPRTAVERGLLSPAPGTSHCEWKGAASYLTLTDGSSAEPVAWYYPTPSEAFARLSEHIAFYPGRIACFLDDERVQPQPGHFYGGWLTLSIAGPVKGEPGTGAW